MRYDVGNAQPANAESRACPPPEEHKNRSGTDPQRKGVGPDETRRPGGSTLCGLCPPARRPTELDLTGPDGTCYTAESELITLLETWCGIALIPSPEIAHRAISAVAITRELHLADATSNAVIGFGMTSEISTTTDYALTQQWAQALRTAGFDGFRYWARHEMTHVHACHALFAPSGDQTSTVAVPTDFTVIGTDALPDRTDLWDALHATAGIEVLDIPGSI